MISGTSAGAMILGDIVFTAKNGSAYSRQSLINPFYSDVTLDDDFLNLLPNIVFDTHFIQRGRFGRLIAFIFNAYLNYGKDVVGIGIDDETAICIDDKMIGYVFGSGSVSIFQKDDWTKYTGSTSEYSIENMRCDQLLHNWKYDLINKRISEYPHSVIQVDSQKFSESPRTDIWLSGNSNIANNINYGLADYLPKVNTETIGLIINQDYENSIADLANYLDESNIKYNIIPLSAATVIQSEIRENIQNSTCFIVAGNDLSSIAYLADTSFLAWQNISK